MAKPKVEDLAAEIARLNQELNRHIEEKQALQRELEQIKAKLERQVE